MNKFRSILRSLMLDYTGLSQSVILIMFPLALLMYFFAAESSKPVAVIIILSCVTFVMVRIVMLWLKYTDVTIYLQGQDKLQFPAIKPEEAIKHFTNSVDITVKKLRILGSIVAVFDCGQLILMGKAISLKKDGYGADIVVIGVFQEVPCNQEYSKFIDFNLDDFSQVDSNLFIKYI